MVPCGAGAGDRPGMEVRGAALVGVFVPVRAAVVGGTDAAGRSPPGSRATEPAADPAAPVARVVGWLAQPVATTVAIATVNPARTMRRAVMRSRPATPAGA